MEEVYGVEIARLVSQIFNQLHKGFNPQDIGNLNKTQLRTLLTLKHMKKCNMSRTCEYIGLERGSMTSVIDSLIDRKLVFRQRDENDRRQVLLDLTPEGHDLAVLYTKELNGHIQGRLEVLDDNCVEKLSEATNLLRVVLANFKEAT